MYKIVVDANVIISAGIKKTGNPRKLLTKYLTSDKCTFITSREMIEEINEVIDRPKFEMHKEEMSNLLRLITTASNIIEIKSNFGIVKEDPDDDVIISTAYDGCADYIVTGDNDLLRLEKYGKTHIREYWRHVENFAGSS